MWLAFFNSREMVEKIHVPAGVPACRLSIIQTLEPQIPWQKAVNISFEDTKERPGIPEITSIIDVWGLAISKVVTGQADAKAALDEAAVKIREILFPLCGRGC